jgi:DNA-binding PadR family transcriptional regulator
MARSSQTDLAVLAVLSVTPMSGYAVREAIRDQLGHFWSESFGQIYPTLSSLTRDGLVTKGAGSRQGSSVFRLTESGRERLLELLHAPESSAPPGTRSVLMPLPTSSVPPDSRHRCSSRRSRESRTSCSAKPSTQTIAPTGPSPSRQVVTRPAHHWRGATRRSPPSPTFREGVSPRWRVRRTRR